MSWINRRELFAGAGGVFAAWLARRSASAAASIPSAPVARVAVVKDTYFGETLGDPYRWMENDKDPDWLPFLKGQNEHARALLDRIPGREQLLKRIQQLSGGAPAASSSTSSALWAPTTSSSSCGKTAARAAFSSIRRCSAARPATCRWTGGGHPPTVRTSFTASPRTAARTRSCTFSAWPTDATCPSASPTPRAPIRSGSPTAAVSSTTS